MQYDKLPFMLPAQKWRSSQLISSKSHHSLSASKNCRSGSDIKISVLCLMKLLWDSPESCWFPETLMVTWFPSPSTPISSCLLLIYPRWSSSWSLRATREGNTTSSSPRLSLLSLHPSIPTPPCPLWCQWDHHPAGVHTSQLLLLIPPISVL